MLASFGEEIAVTKLCMHIAQMIVLGHFLLAQIIFNFTAVDLTNVNNPSAIYKTILVSRNHLKVSIIPQQVSYCTP